MAGEPEVQKLDKAGQVEMRLVAAGARRDMGQPEAAVVTLQSPELASNSQQPWTARLRYAYADALLEVAGVRMRRVSGSRRRWRPTRAVPLMRRTGWPSWTGWSSSTLWIPDAEEDEDDEGAGAERPGVSRERDVKRAGTRSGFPPFCRVCGAEAPTGRSGASGLSSLPTSWRAPAGSWRSTICWLLRSCSRLRQDSAKLVGEQVVAARTGRPVRAPTSGSRGRSRRPSRQKSSSSRMPSVGEDRGEEAEEAVEDVGEDATGASCPRGRRRGCRSTAGGSTGVRVHDGDLLGDVLEDRPLGRRRPRRGRG